MLKENGSPKPFFDFDEDRPFFEVDFYIHPTFKEDEKVSQKTEIEFLENITERAKQIIQQIKSNPNVTAAEISKQIGISKRAVEKQLAKLRTSGILERSGSDKSGYWIIKSSV